MSNGKHCSFNSGYMQAVDQNLSSDVSCSTFTIDKTSAQLSPLSSAGSARQYFERLPGSVASDAASSCLNASGTSLLDDQRGQPRPQLSACDLDAYERDDLVFANGFEF